MSRKFYLFILFLFFAFCIDAIAKDPYCSLIRQNPCPKSDANGKPTHLVWGKCEQRFTGTDQTWSTQGCHVPAGTNKTPTSNSGTNKNKTGNSGTGGSNGAANTSSVKAPSSSIEDIKKTTVIDELTGRKRTYESETQNTDDSTTKKFSETDSDGKVKYGKETCDSKGCSITYITNNITYNHSNVGTSGNAAIDSYNPTTTDSHNSTITGSYNSKSTVSGSNAGGKEVVSGSKGENVDQEDINAQKNGIVGPPIPPSGDEQQDVNDGTKKVDSNAQKPGSSVGTFYDKLSSECSTHDNDVASCERVKFYDESNIAPTDEKSAEFILWSMYKMKYLSCKERVRSKVKDSEINEVCSSPKCTFVPQDYNYLTKGFCVSSLPNPFSGATIKAKHSEVMNSQFSTAGVIAGTPTEIQNALIDKFKDELEREDFYLKDDAHLYLKNGKLSPDFEIKATSEPCGNYLVTPLVVQTFSQEKATKDAACQIYKLEIALKPFASSEAAAIVTPKDGKDPLAKRYRYYVYSDTHLGFLPVMYDAMSTQKFIPDNDVTSTDSAIIDNNVILKHHRCGKEKCKGAKNFCNDVVKKRFKINMETISAWALLGSQDFLAKGNLKFQDDKMEFPYSIDQLRAIRAYCPDISADINRWIDAEKLYIHALPGSMEVPSPAFCQLFLSEGINTEAKIPTAYKYKLAQKLFGQATNLLLLADKCHNIQTVIDNAKKGLPPQPSPNKATLLPNRITLYEKVKTGVMFLDEKLFGSLAADNKLLPVYESYIMNLDALNTASTPDKDVVNTLKQEYKDERKGVNSEGNGKTKKSGKCKSSTKDVSWWTSFKCSINAEAIGGIITGGLAIANFIWQIDQWKEDLALQKKMFEEGQCYPYKKDHDDGVGIKIPFTMAGTTQNYDMYEFCRLTASGALAFMDTCGSLVANKAPQAAIDACYGIQARQKGAFSPQYGGSSPTVAATTAATTAAAGDKEKEKEKKKDDAAAATTAGAAAGAAAPTADKDKEKKAKSPFDSIYQTPYQYGGPANKTVESRYPYGAYDQSSSNKADTSSAGNKNFRPATQIPESTIKSQISGHINTTVDKLGTK